MAAKRKTKAVAKRDPYALPAVIADEFELAISRDRAASAGADTGWEYFKTQGGKMRFNGEEWPEGQPLIVLNAVRQNSYYMQAFDPTNPMGPACAAVDSAGDGNLIPLDGPNKQDEQCNGCWANAFGSDDRGKGKACKNQIVLCVLPFGESTDYEGVGGARLNVPPTALKAWAQYSKRITDGMGRPLSTVATIISIVPDPKSAWGKMQFDFHDVIQDEDSLRALIKRADTDGLENAIRMPDLQASESGGAKSAKTGGQKRIPPKRQQKRQRSSGAST